MGSASLNDVGRQLKGPMRAEFRIFPVLGVVALNFMSSLFKWLKLYYANRRLMNQRKTMEKNDVMRRPWAVQDLRGPARIEQHLRNKGGQEPNRIRRLWDGTSFAYGPCDERER